MKKLNNLGFLGCLLLLTLSSCSVIKCQYSKGWTIGLGKGVEYPEKTSIRKSKRVIYNEQRLSQDSLLKSTFALALVDDSSKVSETSNLYFSPIISSASYGLNQHRQVPKDSIKNTQKSKKKSKNHRRYRSRFYDFIPDNEYEYLAFVFLLGFIIVIAIIWAIYSLIRLIVKALRKGKDLLPDNSTVSPKSNDLTAAADPNQKENGVNQESTFEGDTTFDHSNEMAENTEENIDIEDDNKSKLLSFLVVVALTLGLVTLMALGMQNQ